MRNKIMLMLLVAALAVITFGCSSEAESTLTMDDFIEAFTEAGVEVDSNEKPLFQMIGATDGIIFYYDLKPVKIYEFKTHKELNSAKKEYGVIADYPVNGNFVLETNYEEAVKIFENVK